MKSFTLVSLLKLFLIVGMVLLASLSMSISIMGQSDPITPSQTTPGSTTSLSIYGIEGAQGLTQGTNQIILFISTPSRSAQDPNKFNFIVDRFAISGVNPTMATLHILSPGLPGTMDTRTNEVQIDVSKLTSNVQSANNIGVDELKNSMKPGMSPLIVSMTIDTQTIGSQQSTFQVKNIATVTGDGKVNTFSLSDKPITGTYDVASKKVAMTVPQLSDTARNFLANAGAGQPAGTQPILPP